MPSPHAAAEARPPYVSVISRGTTKVRLGVRASSPPTCIKHLLRQQVKGTRYLPQSDSLFPRTPNFTLPRGPFGIPTNLGIGGASLGHPSHLQRGLVQDRHPLDSPRDKQTELCVENPRRSINPRRKFRPPPTLADLRTRTRTGRADTSARLLKVM
ncbi:hypothetical protein BHE74_00015159 [Ensete ventricosum]|nr:hypothetical protein BHE74_00015159 [Ensete ventricosum]